MKIMTELENIVMTRTGCNRETANLVANDIINEVEPVVMKEFIADFVERLKRRTDYFHKNAGHSVYEAVTLYDINKLTKDYGL
jgi:hypothetical protein